jgi:hypothetical protein
LKKIILLLLIFAFLSACSYSHKEAIKNGDVVDLHGNITNLDKLEQFITNSKIGKEDELRITRYTIEGDPMFYHLSYDDGKIKFSYDNSKDKFGSTNKYTVDCLNIEIREIKESKRTGSEYILNNCSGETKEFSVLSKVEYTPTEAYFMDFIYGDVG